MKGAYALAIVSEYEPDKLIAVRLASPLIVGVGDGENFIASDIPAILEHTRDFYVLEDGEMAVLTRDDVRLMKTDGEPVERETLRVDWDIVTAEKGGYDHFMLKEIHEQPRAIRDTLTGRVKGGQADLSREIALSPEEIRQIERIHFVACGTAYHAGLVGKYVIEELVRIPVEVDVASEYRYRNPILTPRTLVVVVSQSGETADTLAALREAKKAGSRVLAITNVVGSTVAREADDVFITQAGPEIAVASTKAYTSQLIAIYLLGLYLARIRGTRSEAELAEVVKHLEELPELAERSWSWRVRPPLGRGDRQEGRFVLHRQGAGLCRRPGGFPQAEGDHLHSLRGYTAGELKHGTLALIEEGVPVIALATQTALYDKMVSNIEEVKARGAQVLGLALEGDAELHKLADEVLTIPRTLPFLTPVLTVIPLQLLAYHACVARGYDVDKPRNLAKSVTVE